MQVRLTYRLHPGDTSADAEIEERPIMVPKMEIRAFTSVDADVVVALWQRCGLTRPWNDPLRDIERKRAMQAEWFLVGTLGGALVATAMAGYDGHRGWVYYLAVAPEHRNQGYGRRLMDEVERLLLAAGCPKINLQIRSDNDGVVAFYEALGYRRDAVASLGKRLVPDGPPQVDLGAMMAAERASVVKDGPSDPGEPRAVEAARDAFDFPMPTPEACFFCERIARGTGAAVIASDELTVMRVNGRPFQPGQALVIPRRHAPTLFDLTDLEAEALMRAARRLAAAVTRAFDAEGILLYQNNGRLSGQEVPHFHLHVVPQYHETSPWGNGPRHIAALEGKPFIPSRPSDLDEDARRAVAARIRAAL